MKESTYNFVDFLINYDLPWNPMRVEQRIGRLDRLNQKSETISIINFSLKDTIEEYILERLYERIHIFEESIGDLEEILGEKTEELMLDLLNPKLNEKELKEEADRQIRAIADQMELERKLENEAMNLVAFSDYILSTVDKSREQKRWLTPDELKAFVEDFFQLQYPGTVITPNQKIESLYQIKLSEDAKIDLKLFKEKTRISTSTFLDRQPVNCFFDSKVAGTMGKANHELIDPTHPLIQWIRDKYEPQSSREQPSLRFQTVSASTLNLKATDLDIKTGTYIYVIQCWKFEGIRIETRLSYKAICLEDEQELSNELTENLINTTAIHGKHKPNVINLINIEQIIKVYEQCQESLSLDFADNEILFEAENTDKCNTQESSVKAYADRKRKEFEERIERFKREEKLSIISAEAGKIGKNTERLNLALKKIDKKRKIATSNPTLATGIIFVEN